MRKYISAVAVALLLVATPVLAQSTDVQAQIAALLAQVAQLTKIIAELKGGAMTPSTATTPACLNLTQSMGPDDTDEGTSGEVSKLQGFLVSQGHLAAHLPRGYFGPATMRALQAWQKQKGIASSGDADSTGYGFFGPKTRTQMRCGALVAQSVMPTGQNVPDTIQPTDTGTVKIKVSSPRNGAEYTVGETIRIVWDYAGAPPDSQVVLNMDLQIAPPTVGVGRNEYQHPLLTSSQGTGKRDIYTGPPGYLSIPGTYEVRAKLRKCEPTGCNTYYGSQLPVYAISDPITIYVKASDKEEVFMHEVCRLGESFESDLKEGDTSSEVAAIRTFLGASGDSPVFDSSLAQFVKAFQKRYASKLLEPYDLLAPTGIWGPAERAKANAINAACAPAKSASSESAPSCEITLDKPTYYKFRDTVTVSWTSKNADATAFKVPGPGKDAIQVPATQFPASGTIQVVASVGGLPTVTLKAYRTSDGASATCEKIIPVL